MPASLIAAVAKNLVIGDKGRLPWRLGDDMARFKRITMGHAVVMGRRTFDSLGKPLPGRRNLVLTRSTDLSIPGCQAVRTREEALAVTEGSELFVIGGAEVYALFLPVAERLYMTHVDVEVPGDAFFPEVRWDEWRVLSETPGTTAKAGSLPHRFVDYERTSR